MGGGAVGLEEGKVGLAWGWGGARGMRGSVVV